MHGSPCSGYVWIYTDVFQSRLTQDTKPVNGESEAEKKDMSEGESKDPMYAEQEEESDHKSQNNER